EQNSTEDHPRGGEERGRHTGEKPLHIDDLDCPEERRGEDHRLALAERDRAGVPDEPGLARDQEGDRENVRDAEALVEQRHSEQRDPDHERFLDERGLRSLAAGEALEEQDERDAAADEPEDEELCPPTGGERPELDGAARRGEEDQEQEERGN